MNVQVDATGGPIRGNAHCRLSPMWGVHPPDFDNSTLHAPLKPPRNLKVHRLEVVQKQKVVHEKNNEDANDR